MFYLFDWDDAVADIREQFPLDRDVTQRIAEQQGVEHPRDVKTRTPLVMTTDFLVDMVRDGRQVLLALAVKPAEELDKPRVLEKLDYPLDHPLGNEAALHRFQIAGIATAERTRR